MLVAEPGLSVWVLAARPKTLWAAVAPVIIGAAMAFSDGQFHGPSVLCALLGALLIQIGANFVNDYSDSAKGTDTAGRLGPTRVTQAGLVAPHVMKRATVAVFLAACVPGLYIVVRGGWPFVVIGLLSILFGILYTAGPYPLGYLGLGDLLVLIFFGPVAVGGTYYVQALEINRTIVIAGLAPGLLSVAILTVNNLRDIDQDRLAGKRTLAVRFGRTFARFEYVSCLVAGSVAIPAALCAITRNHLLALASSAVLVMAMPTVRAVFTRTDGDSLNDALAATGKLLLVFSLVFSAGWAL